MINMSLLSIFLGLEGPLSANRSHLSICIGGIVYVSCSSASSDVKVVSTPFMHFEGDLKGRILADSYLMRFNCC